MFWLRSKIGIERYEQAMMGPAIRFIDAYGGGRNVSIDMGGVGSGKKYIIMSSTMFGWGGFCHSRFL